MFPTNSDARNKVWSLTESSCMWKCQELPWQIHSSQTGGNGKQTHVQKNPLKHKCGITFHRTTLLRELSRVFIGFTTSKG